MTGSHILAGAVDDFGNHIAAHRMSYATYMARYWFFKEAA